MQFTAFNEGDCWSVFKDKPFDVAGIVQLIKELDPTRLVDTDSGGGANNMHIGDVSFGWYNPNCKKNETNETLLARARRCAPPRARWTGQ